MKLVRFLMNLPEVTNQTVTVELKNGTTLNGQLLSCTPEMNLSLKNVKIIVLYHEPQLLQYINIRGNQIRQIILPDDLNIEVLLLKSVKKTNKQHIEQNKTNTFTDHNQSKKKDLTIGEVRNLKRKTPPF